MTDTPLIAATGIRHAFAGRPVLDGIDIAIAPGERVGLIGPNGAGKTTLLRILAGLLRPDAGMVRLGGIPLDQVPPRDRARALGYLAQAGDVHWPLPVEQVVGLGRLPHLSPFTGPQATDRAAVRRAMDRCGVTPFRDRPVATLSGGERARVLLARTLAGEPTLLLADEPVAGLDPCHQLQVMDLLAGRGGAEAGAGAAGDGLDRGVGVVMVIHDLALAARYCSRLVLIGQGRIVADGPPDAVLDPALLARIYGVEVASVTLPDGQRVPLPWRRLSPGAAQGGAEAGPGAEGTG
ncbi:MAG: iron(III) dicitrate transport ATP-binding protein fecE [Pseudomonadota bacterium]|jgi:iron complex transport system ATP-binding protein